MLFFALLLVMTLAARALPFLHDWPARMRLAMAVALVFVGVDHWLSPERYLPMMPPWIPGHLFLVLFTGVAEIAGGFGLLMPRLRAAAAWCLAVYFVAVFPANVHNAIADTTIVGLPSADWYYDVRLVFQPFAIWWALFSAERIRWPLGTKAAVQP